MARTGPWLSRGWDCIQANPAALVLTAFLWMLVIGIAAEIAEPLPIVIIGPVLAGVYAASLTGVTTGRVDLNRIQDGFRSFVQTMLAGILITIFTAFGLALLIIPGIIIAAVYLFALLLIVDRKMPFWDAMEESRKKVQQDIVGFFGFALALIGINLLGAACFGVGILVSIPITWCAVAAAYRDLWPDKAEEAKLAEPESPTPEPQPPEAQ